MGREKLCSATWVTSAAKFGLLESGEIILRGAIAATLPLSTLRSPRVSGDS